MSDPSDAEPSPPQHGAKEPASYLRLPWYVVAAALILVLGAALAIGLNATRSTRSEPAAAPPPATSTPPIRTAAIATAPTPAPGATTPEPAAAATIPPPAPATVTPAPTPLILSLASTSTPILSSATDVPTPLPTVEPTLAAEVGAAYENFWRVRSDATLTLDSSHLHEVLAGPYLVQVTDFVAQLERDGRAIKTQVTLNYTVVKADIVTAIVHDNVSDVSFYVRAGTDDPITEPSHDLLRLEVTLRKIEGVWKVTDSVSAD